MPVELQKIPGKISEPAPPILSRWLIVILFITGSGIILSLYLWPTDVSTHTDWFRFCTIALPLFSGLICYVIRLRVYENKRERVLYWNHLHREQYEQQVLLGQRSVGLLGKAYITPAGCNKLAAALLRGEGLLRSQYFPHFQSTRMTARLDTSDIIFTEESYKDRLVSYLTKLICMLDSELQAIPGAISVRIQHDGSINNDEFRNIWQGIFPKVYVVKQLLIDTEGDGLMWLDVWMDHQCTPVMLSIEVNLFLEPHNYQTESVSALLLASSKWLSQNNVTPEVVIHRPVVATDNFQSTENMLQWGSLSAKESHVLWRTRIDQDAVVNLAQQAAKLDYSPGEDEVYFLDDIFGRPAAAIGNILLICACEYAIESGKPQWLIAQHKTVHQAIVRRA
ncbi:hypothetical protein AAF302_000009 [Pluralibacter gergoviae]|uniref:hypothetical protein n=1 Tax=Pluralibacter gergoviae TaxID=61647 RepID=UPI0006517CA0|nr:hypothetical protein [Pluralibacter gergoviae]KMK35081.1 hypothetical protein ABW13_24205 [Pluralibacter gergoviae]